jgi:hypothetical protein
MGQHVQTSQSRQQGRARARAPSPAIIHMGNLNQIMLHYSLRAYHSACGLHQPRFSC